MSRVIELVGMLAPFVALVLLFMHRRRAAFPATLGMVGAVVAGLGTVGGFLGSKTIWLSAGAAEGAVEQLEGWGLIRFCLVAGGLLLLFVAALVGHGRTVPRIPLAIGGMIAAAIGGAMRFVPFDLGDTEGFVRVMATMAIEAVQFGLLGLGILLVGIAVVSGRDDGPEPLNDTVRVAGNVLSTMQQMRGGQQHAGRQRQTSGWESWLIQRAGPEHPQDRERPPLLDLDQSADRGPAPDQRR